MNAGDLGDSSLVDWVVRGFFGLLSLLGINLMTRVHRLERANFTRADAKDMRAELREDLQRMERKIDDLASRVYPRGY